MKLAVCCRCRHKIFSPLYEPKFCRDCGSGALKIYSFAEWLILAALIAAYFFI